MKAATLSTNAYPRNRVLTTLMVVNTLLFALCGMVTVSRNSAFVSLLWFGGAVLFYINFLWSKRTPFLQFTQEGLILFPAMMRPKRELTWTEIASVQKTGEKTIYLVLKNGERVKLPLFSINKEDRIPLLQRLNTQLAKKS